MSHSTITFIVIAAAVVLFIVDVVAPELVAIGAAVALYATGVIGAAQVASGFGDPAVIFIASMFVISEGLDSTGITAWAGETLIARTGDRPRLLIVLMLGLVALLGALITPNGAVAALIPVVVVMSRRIGREPSSYLMPLAYAACAGALLVLTGSPVNVLVSEASAETGHGRFGFLSFGLVGIPLTIGTIAICVLLGHRLIPQRKPRTINQDLSRHARTLAAQYDISDELLSEHRLDDGLLGRQRGAAEVVIPPRSELGSGRSPGWSPTAGTW